MKFFYPIVTAFTTLWAANFGQPPSSRLYTSLVSDITTGSATATDRSRSHRTRTRASRSTTATSGTVSTQPDQPVLRRSARLKRKYIVPEKVIIPFPRRAVRREGAIANIPLTTSGNTTTPQQRLRREDSFILVDCGNHFRMVKPAYAMRFFQPVPANFNTVAPYHALGANVGEQELREMLLAVPINDATIGTKRTRAVEEEELGGDADDDARPRKRRRS